MKLPNIFYSLRTRLLFLLAALLVATLGVQYYLNLREERRTAEVIAEQEQALAAGFALAVQSISVKQYLVELQKEARYPLLQKEAGRVANIFVVDDAGQIEDSLDSSFNPEQMDDGSVKYLNIADVLQAPLVDAGPSTDDFKSLLRTPAAPSNMAAGGSRAFPFKVKTSRGTNYIIVVLGSAMNPNRGAARQLIERFLPTLLVLLLATLATIILLWRFTRPIKDLSNAAQRVAAGDFDFRVPADRRDEMGTLAATFNEMITRLEGARELESRLNQVERSAVIGRLASAIAHEIRNPLNYINLTLDHLRTTLAPEAEQKRELFGRLTAQIKTEVARINTRISEFLKYTRPTKLELRPLDLRATIADALSLVEVQAEESGIETRIESDGAVARVEGDAASLRSVFTNLIINGMQAMEGTGGRLTIRLSAGDDGRARVEVADTGRGIPPENISQIFEPYFSTKETGTGLGLAIVKKAVEDHGGDVSVESADGAGTTFTINLPTEKAVGD